MNKGGITNWCKGIFNQLCTLRGGGQPQKTSFLVQNRKMGFFNVGVFWVFLGLN